SRFSRDWSSDVCSSDLAFYERFADYGVTMKALKTNFGCAENIGGATFSDAHGHFRVEYVDLHWLQEKRIAQTVSPLEGDENTAEMGRASWRERVETRSI